MSRHGDWGRQASLPLPVASACAIIIRRQMPQLLPSATRLTHLSTFVRPLLPRSKRLGRRAAVRGIGGGVARGLADTARSASGHGQPHHTSGRGPPRLPADSGPARMTRSCWHDGEGAVKSTWHRPGSFGLGGTGRLWSDGYAFRNGPREAAGRLGFNLQEGRPMQTSTPPLSVAPTGRLPQQVAAWEDRAHRFWRGLAWPAWTSGVVLGVRSLVHQAWVTDSRDTPVGIASIPGGSSTSGSGGAAFSPCHFPHRDWN